MAVPRWVSPQGGDFLSLERWVCRERERGGGLCVARGFEGFAAADNEGRKEGKGEPVSRRGESGGRVGESRWGLSRRSTSWPLQF